GHTDGRTAIDEVTMLALIFLLLGVVILLVVAGRIWINPTPLGARTIESAATDRLGEPGTLNNLSEGKDSGV
ncbi:MAG: hypothetical protein CV090_15665, partial [Nitrospira sp. WS238]|nr:hypothetical protein [Nitrospira sp. WS238]